MRNSNVRPGDIAEDESGVSLSVGTLLPPSTFANAVAASRIALEKERRGYLYVPLPNAGTLGGSSMLS